MPKEGDPQRSPSKIAYEEAIHTVKIQKAEIDALKAAVKSLTGQLTEANNTIMKDRRLALEEEAKRITVLTDENLAALSFDELQGIVKVARVAKPIHKTIHFGEEETDKDSPFTIGDVFAFHPEGKKG